jgi:hypothetical protein
MHASLETRWQEENRELTQISHFTGSLVSQLMAFIN